MPPNQPVHPTSATSDPSPHTDTAGNTTADTDTDTDNGRSGRRGRRGGRRRRTAAGAVLVTGLSLVAVGARASTDAGAGAASTFELPPPAAVSSGTPTPPDGAHASPDLDLTAPEQLVLPARGVHASVQHVQTTDGVLAVPADPRVVGWWTGSALPGSSTGATVIDGHVDTAQQGRGALFGLSTLNAGDPVSLSSATTTVTYRVYARRTYPKGHALPPDLFSDQGPPHLVLITCGGPFERSTQHYRDNVVVLAAPVDLSPTSPSAA